MGAYGSHFWGHLEIPLMKGALDPNPAIHHLEKGYLDVPLEVRKWLVNGFCHPTEYPIYK